MPDWVERCGRIDALLQEIAARAADRMEEQQ
jgi:hypothetical protein